MKKTMRLSIVSTLYKSAPYLDEFVSRIVAALALITNDYEIILVNDGSPDNSLEMAIGFHEEDSRVKVIDLSRNFGHHAAIVAGLEHAKGNTVFLIDCDLEEQPEWLSIFEKEMQDTGADVVFGVQQRRVQSRVSNFIGSLFWKALNVMSNVSIPHNPMTCRLMNRAYVDALLGVEDRVLYLAGVFAWAGFKQRPLSLVKTPRIAEHHSTYSFSRKLLQVADSFSSFSVAPLILVFMAGLFIWFASVCYALFLLVMKLFVPELVLSGFTSVMLSIWFLGGFIIVAIGTVGLYIAKIFQEVKRRPLFITKSIYEETDNE